MKPSSLTLVVLLAASSFVVLGFAVSGCSSSDTKLIAEARRNLQLSEPQKAIDSLADEEPSGEYHYLKCIALNRLGRSGPAMAEVELALELEPSSPKYQGLKLKLELFQTKVEAIDEMISLHEDNRSNPAVSLFSIYAYQAKSLRLKTLRKVRAAAAHDKRAKEALDVCVKLISEIPEYHIEVLNLVIQEDLKDEAELLAEQLLELDPDNPKLARYKLQVMLLTEKFEKAAELAKSIYHRNDRRELAAVLYSHVLAQVKANEDFDREMRNLFDSHPRSVDTVTNYGIYLAKSGRMDDAIKVIESAIKQHKLIAPRTRLISSAISLPLEAGKAAIAEAQLERYRLQMNDSFLIRLFEGRIAYLNKNYGEALDKLQSIIEADRRDISGARPLASEALRWIQVILNDEAVEQQMKKAANLVQRMKLGVTDPDGENGESEKNDKSSEKKDDTNKDDDAAKTDE